MASMPLSSFRVLYEAAAASTTLDDCAFHLLLSGNLAIGALLKRPRHFVAVRIIEQPSEDSFLSSKDWLAETFPMATGCPIKLFIPSSQSILVPETLYNIEDHEYFFQLNYPFSKQADALEAEYISGLKAYFIYSLPKNYKRLLAYRYPEVKVYPSATSWLEMLLSESKDYPSLHVHLLWTGKNLRMAFFHGQKLLLFNNYPAGTPEDILYYILFVSEQMKVPIMDCRYYISGNIFPDDDSLKMLKEYIHIAPEPLPALFSPIEELPPILLKNIYCTVLCA